MSFAPIRRLRVAEQIAEAIRGAILVGTYNPGSNLPSERDLAEQFEVNRSTVREALQRLEAWGLIEMRHGGGTTVQDFLVNAGMTLLPHLIAPGGSPDPRLIYDLLELRVMVLGWTAARAAERRDLGALSRLDTEIDSLAEAVTPDQLQEFDFAYFRALVELADNRVLGLLAHAIHAVYRENRALFAAMYVPGAFDLTPHREARAAIAARDGRAAQAAMERHARTALALFPRPEVLHA